MEEISININYIMCKILFIFLASLWLIQKETIFILFNFVITLTHNLPFPLRNGCSFGLKIPHQDDYLCLKQTTFCLYDKLLRMTSWFFHLNRVHSCPIKYLLGLVDGNYPLPCVHQPHNSVIRDAPIKLIVAIGGLSIIINLSPIMRNLLAVIDGVSAIIRNLRRSSNSGAKVSKTRWYNVSNPLSIRGMGRGKPN